MARKTATQATNNGVTATKTAAARKAVRKTTRSSATAAVKKSSEIKPRRVTNGAMAQLKSPKVYVPLAMLVGLGAAAVRKFAMAASKHAPSALPRMAKEISPRFSDAVRALADLGRELRSKIR